MAEPFDAYHKWLGIPPEDQPPTRYRLLGIKTFESDLDVISSAADQRMVHVRGFQTGEHVELSQQILNELSLARVCLLDSVKKAEYDQELTQRLGHQHGLSKKSLQPQLPKDVGTAANLVRFQCENCGKWLGARPSQAGELFGCVYCGATVLVPSSDDEDRPPIQRSALTRQPHSGTKTCPMCAEPIAVQAIKCKHCGSVLVPMEQAGFPVPAVSPAGVAVPALISAIANLLVGLFWFTTCFGIIFAIPMFILCIFEFAFYAKAGRLHPANLASQARTLGVFEIIVGLANIVSLICGIIVLINASKQPAGYFTPEQTAAYQTQEAVEDQTKQRHLAEMERGRRQRRYATKMHRRAQRKALGARLDQTLRSICGEDNDILFRFVQGFVWILIIAVPLVLAVVAAGWILSLL